MKTNFILLLVTLLIFSCTQSKKNNNNKYQNYINSKSDTTNLVSEMILSNDFSKTLYKNDYTYKDGKKGVSGISFIMQVDTSKYIVSAKHIIGRNYDLDKDIKTNIQETLSSWNFSSIDSSIKLTTDINDLSETDNDVIIFNKVNSAENKNLKAFKLSKNPENLIVGKFNPENKYFLVALDKLHKEFLLPLRFGTRNDGFLVFIKEDEEFNTMGLSGAPIIDKNGFVIAILTGSNSEDKSLLIGSKVAPKELK